MISKPSDKKLALFQAALELISTQGLHATPMSQIAAKAKIGIGTIYNYFPSKEALINELYLYNKITMIDYLQNVVWHESTVTGEVRELLRAVIYFYIQNPNILFFTEQCENSPIITETTKQEGMKSAEFMYGLVSRLKTENVIKDISFEILISILLGALISLTKLCLSGAVKTDTPAFEISLTALCDILLR